MGLVGLSLWVWLGVYGFGSQMFLIFEVHEVEVHRLVGCTILQHLVSKFASPNSKLNIESFHSISSRFEI